MNYAERLYRSTATRIGIAMLSFLAFFHLLNSAALVLISVIVSFMPPVAGTVLYELASAILYAASFSLPVLVYRLLPGQTPIQPMRLELCAPRETPLYILFGVAINSAAAALNAIMVSFFDYAEFAEEYLWQTPSYTTNYELVLMFFSVAVVPAFVEEFLFRGVVLSNLLPYGRTTAIVGSALLFGLMHQNIQQFFYTTVAGLVLGWIYVRTQSIWPCVLMHFFNNFQSVLQTAVVERLPEATGDVVLNWMDGSILLLGAVCGVLLLLSERDHRSAVRRSGVFEQEPPAECYTPYPLSFKARIKHFFNIPMIIFTVISVLLMLYYALMALLMPALLGGMA